MDDEIESANVTDWWKTLAVLLLGAAVSAGVSIVAFAGKTVSIEQVEQKVREISVTKDEAGDRYIAAHTPYAADAKAIEAQLVAELRFRQQVTKDLKAIQVELSATRADVRNLERALPKR